ncbi:MAG: porin, partial [Gammaproteobacteria bacterium]|nr:porin [Gammaproteobacteria bacterium]
GVIDASGRIHLSPIIGGYAAIQHWWTEDLRTTATAGFAQADHATAADPGSVNNMIYSTHLNLIWSPSLNASIGIEWLHGYRELEDGRNGELDRIQLTSLYRF